MNALGRLAAALLFLAVAPSIMSAGPASALSCVEPESAVERALKSTDQTFFTGIEIKSESTGSDSSNVTFDVQLLWHGPKLPEQVGAKHLIKTVPFHAFGSSTPTVGRRYHVLLEDDGSANPCSVYDTEEWPHLTDGPDPESSYGEYTGRHGGDSVGHAVYSGETANVTAWWIALGLGTAVLGAATAWGVSLHERA